MKGVAFATGHNSDTLATARQILGDAATVLQSDDATRIEAIEALATRVSETMDAIDLLFINAGATTVKPFTEVSPEEYDDFMALNSRAPFFALQKLSPLIRDGGSIVVTTSVANVKGIAGSSLYSATKAALRSMARTWARELAPRRIRVNAVSPGPISTTILDKAMGKEAERRSYEDLGGTAVCRTGGLTFPGVADLSICLDV